MSPARAPLSREVSESSVASHQSGIIKEHWNDLPADMVTPPTRSLTSTPLSTSPLPSDEAGGEEEFSVLLDALFSGTPTTLAERERKMLHEKVLKSLPAITLQQKREVATILRGLMHEKTLGQKEAKEAVVVFMMRERGVAGWAGGVRRGVESAVLNYSANT